MAGETRIPHSLRLSMFFLRLSVGLSLFYLGFSTIFNTSLAADISGRSLPDMYHWALTAGNVPWIHWTLLITGICLALGFATRIAAVVALGLTLASYAPTITGGASIGFSSLTSDAVLLIFVLAILFFGKAGTYLGFDSFMHFSFKSQANKK